jgi:hypothetical protein
MIRKQKQETNMKKFQSNNKGPSVLIDASMQTIPIWILCRRQHYYHCLLLKESLFVMMWLLLSQWPFVVWMPTEDVSLRSAMMMHYTNHKTMGITISRANINGEQKGMMEYQELPVRI